jgi:hypothetical protein
MPSATGCKQVSVAAGDTESHRAEEFVLVLLIYLI